MAISLPIGALFTVLLNVFKHGMSLSKYNYLKGYYYVCNQQEVKFINSPERIPNFLKIEIRFSTPKVLNIVSKDFDRKNFKKWKTWTNEIAMNGQSGTGTYIYDIGNESGTHEIVVQGKDKIIVRVIDKGKADWAKNQDNEPASQTWIRVTSNDLMLASLKKLLL